MRRQTLRCQVDPSTVSIVADQIPMLLSSLDTGVVHTALANPLEEFEGWVKSHPLQDAAIVSISVFALNALKAGASLPVAIVAGTTP